MFKSYILYFIAFTIELLLEEVTSRAVYIEGSVTETEVTHFEFIQRLGNPCGIVRLEQQQEQTSYSGSMSNYYTDDSMNNTLFYQSMVIAVDAGLEKLRLLQHPDQRLPDCSVGVSLDTLPPTPTLTALNDDQLFPELYKSAIFLAAHLHIMGLDRQLTVVGVNDVLDDNIDERDGLPSWRYLRCGNESDNFMLKLAEMTMQIENILCTLVSSATLGQRGSFREPFNKLIATTFFRYHSSCSTLQTRDCLVMKEIRNSLNAMSAKFNTLLKNSDGSNTNPAVNSGDSPIQVVLMGNEV